MDTAVLEKPVEEVTVDLGSMVGTALRDRKSNGKLKPWVGRKGEQEKYVDRLEFLEPIIRKEAQQAKRDHLPAPRRYGLTPSTMNSVRYCGDLLYFDQYADGHQQLKNAYFCHRRLCPMCAWRRSLKNMVYLSLILTEAVKREPKGKFVFLTLTEKNCDFSDLHDVLAEQSKALRRMMRYVRVDRAVLGYVRTTEVTVNLKSWTFHPHIHLLLMVKPSYFTRHYIKKDEWIQLWRKARKLDYDPSISIEKVKPSEKDPSLVAAAKEVGKYQTKPGSYLSEDFSRDVRVLDKLEDGLYRSRLLSYGGLLAQCRKDLDLEDDEDSEDLVTFEQKAKPEELSAPVKTVLYLWQHFAQNYVAVEELDPDSKEANPENPYKDVINETCFLRYGRKNFD